MVRLTTGGIENTFVVTLPLSITYNINDTAVIRFSKQNGNDTAYSFVATVTDFDCFTKTAKFTIASLDLEPGEYLLELQTGSIVDGFNETYASVIAVVEKNYTKTEKNNGVVVWEN